LPLEAQAHLRRVADAGKRMDALIQDLLQFSRLGTASLTRRPIDMNRIVRDAFEELRQAHPDRRIELRLQSLPETVADPSMLTQVVVNLLSNAIKFTRSREVAVIEVGARSERAETLYSVADNGAGFDMRQASRLFKAFQRLHSPKEFEGTGVGLSIVQRIVQRHGGRVWAEAVVDQGATFYFTLPR